MGFFKEFLDNGMFLSCRDEKCELICETCGKTYVDDNPIEGLDEDDQFLIVHENAVIPGVKCQDCEGESFVIKMYVGVVVTNVPTVTLGVPDEEE